MTTEMCVYCFDILIDRFEKKGNVRTPNCILDNGKEYPLFVTWDLEDQHSGAYNLRGCIGCLSPLPLHKIGEYAITSAMRDRRFNPVEQDEISRLRCSVSLLTDYEYNKQWNDWVVGTHGIIIDFLVGGTKYNATYLPQVAAEQQWDRKEAVLSLIRKAGYRGKIDNNVLLGIELTRYQSSKAYCTYEDYVDQKNKSM
jgi:AMME syndrome candidate gene 1 protein